MDFRYTFLVRNIDYDFSNLRFYDSESLRLNDLMYLLCFALVKDMLSLRTLNTVPCTMFAVPVCCFK